MHVIPMTSDPKTIMIIQYVGDNIYQSMSTHKIYEQHQWYPVVSV